jgi:hypothetical protein
MIRSKILVADDYTIAAQGLGSLLENDLELVGIVDDCRKTGLCVKSHGRRSAGSRRSRCTARAFVRFTIARTTAMKGGTHPSGVSFYPVLASEIRHEQQVEKDNAP